MSPVVPVVPSIKATLFQFAADDIARLLATGRLTRLQLERLIHADDFQYLGKKPAVTSWVPMATYVRVSTVGIDIENPPSRDEYLREAGLRAAAKLHKMGLYMQFEVSADRWGPSVGRILVTLAAVS